jgi:hypothetical protein
MAGTPAVILDYKVGRKKHTQWSMGQKVFFIPHFPRDTMDRYLPMTELHHPAGFLYFTSKLKLTEHRTFTETKQSETGNPGRATETLGSVNHNLVERQREALLRQLTFGHF